MEENFAKNREGLKNRFRAGMQSFGRWIKKQAAAFWRWFRATLAELFLRWAESLRGIEQDKQSEEEQIKALETEEQQEPEFIDIEDIRRERGPPKVELQKIGSNFRLYIRYEMDDGKCSILLEDHTLSGRLLNGEVYFWLDKPDRERMAKYTECKLYFEDEESKERFICENKLAGFINSEVRCLSLCASKATPKKWRQALGTLTLPEDVAQSAVEENGDSGYTLILQKDLQKIKRSYEETNRTLARVMESKQKLRWWMHNRPGMAHKTIPGLRIEAESNPDTGELFALRFAITGNEVWKTGTKLVLRTPDEEKKFEVDAEPVRISLASQSTYRDSAFLPVAICADRKDPYMYPPTVVALVALPDNEKFDTGKHVLYLGPLTEDDMSEVEEVTTAQIPAIPTYVAVGGETTAPTDITEDDFLFEVVDVTLVLQVYGSLLQVKYGAAEIYAGEVNLVFEKADTIPGEVDDFEISFEDAAQLLLGSLMDDETVILDLPSHQPKKSYRLSFYVKPASYDDAYEVEQHALKFELVEENVSA